MLLYDGFGVGRLVNENGRASNAEFPSSRPSPQLYNDFAPRRLLPNAANCANGEAAPLFTLPLTRNPSAARRARSASLSEFETLGRFEGFERFERFEGF